MLAKKSPVLAGKKHKKARPEKVKPKKVEFRRAKMAKDVHTSDDEPRPNDPEVTPFSKPSLPPVKVHIGEGARVGAMRDYATTINSQLTYWSSATVATPVLAQGAAYDHGSLTKNVNAIINTMNASCTEFGILTGVGQRMKTYVNLDYGAFTSVMNAINAQLAAMQTAKP